MNAEQAFQQALSLSKKYTKETAEGMGAVKGKDGFSPIISTRQVEDGTEVSITDATHTETFTVKNGTDIEGTNDYKNLKNKPSINDVELEKDKTFEDLGMIPLTNMEIMQIISKATN